MSALTDSLGSSVGTNESYSLMNSRNDGITLEGMKIEAGQIANRLESVIVRAKHLLKETAMVALVSGIKVRHVYTSQYCACTVDGCDEEGLEDAVYQIGEWEIPVKLIHYIRKHGFFGFEKDHFPPEKMIEVLEIKAGQAYQVIYTSHKTWQRIFEDTVASSDSIHPAGRVRSDSQSQGIEVAKGVFACRSKNAHYATSQGASMTCEFLHILRPGVPTMSMAGLARVAKRLAQSLSGSSMPDVDPDAIEEATFVEVSLENFDDIPLNVPLKKEKFAVGTRVSFTLEDRRVPVLEEGDKVLKV